MNKKHWFAIFAVISAMMTGCTDKSENTLPSETTAAVNNYTAAASDITVTGEVISITGNEVTLALGTLSEKPAGEKTSGERRGSLRDGEDFNTGERPDFESGEKPDWSNGEMPDWSNGEKPDWGNGEMPDFGNNERFGSRERKSGVSVEKSGEEATYIIPVGMTINGLTGRSTDYSGISTGMVLTLTVNEDGVVCAASVE